VTCTPFRLAGGATGIICTGRRPRKKCLCGRVATLLCDWKTPEATRRTCDAHLCLRCTTSPAPDKDLCAKHAKEFESRQINRRQQ
jgi:hypothetical protein